MNNAKKLSTVLGAIVIAFLSIYAVNGSFMTTNNTPQAVTVTLQLQSGAQTLVTVAPLSSIPTNINGDQVMGLTIFGGYAPAGPTTVIPNPSGGSVSVSWQIVNGNPCSGSIDLFEVN